MEGFRTARALVLDDDPSEAITVIQALGKLGVGATYLDGTSVSNRVKCNGLRLLVLDMVLESIGADANDPKACIEILMAALIDSFESSGEPLIVLCWTKHKDLVAAFQAAFEGQFGKIIHRIISLEKSVLKQNQEVLLAEVKKCMEDCDYLAVLLRWEQDVHSAVTRTTERLTSVFRVHQAESNGELTKSAYAICAKLAIAGRGTRVATENGAQVLASLLDTLTPLLFDALSAQRMKPTVVSDSTTSRFKEAVTQALDTNLSEAVKSSLNTLFILNSETILGLCPGCIYEIKDHGSNFDNTTNLVKWDKVIEDATNKGDSIDIQNVRRILIEITPACDFAQNKQATARFVAGFLCTKATIKKLKVKTNYLNIYGPVKLPDSPNELYLVVNLHFIASCDKEVGARLESVLQMKATPLGDLLASIASHMSRPGYLSVS